MHEMFNQQDKVAVVTFILAALALLTSTLLLSLGTCDQPVLAG